MGCGTQASSNDCNLANWHAPRPVASRRPNNMLRAFSASKIVGEGEGMNPQGFCRLSSSLTRGYRRLDRPQQSSQLLPGRDLGEAPVVVEDAGRQHPLEPQQVEADEVGRASRTVKLRLYQHL